MRTCGLTSSDVSTNWAVSQTTFVELRQLELHQRPWKRTKRKSRRNENLSDTHRIRERSPRIRKKKIDAVLRERGTLACEVCTFDFAETYGEALGGGFTEVHHVVPLSEASGSATTRLIDLAVVCSNCHRMLHRAKPWIRPDELRLILDPNENPTV